jgi:hypothetical protein
MSSSRLRRSSKRRRFSSHSWSRVDGVLGDDLDTEPRGADRALRRRQHAGTVQCAMVTARHADTRTNTGTHEQRIQSSEQSKRQR